MLGALLQCGRKKCKEAWPCLGRSKVKGIEASFHSSGTGFRSLVLLTLLMAGLLAHTAE